ncbi:citrate/succinate antiporter [Mesobacillus campisalis]|uniref:Citrate/succinate antiporter n=1 Tax=Mesobacillus campisalis TaxID=1408103 RepID=A0A0M2T2C6_9BACI|nr:SLC13 family permease [Mesobacillus campisalis]KKK39392.1 citrate/succinate antiporter [Mesobacillus campisalis]
MNVYSRLERYQANARTSSKANPRSIYAQPLVVALLAICLFALVFTPGLPYEGKIAILAFGLSMVLWIGTKFPAGFVALAVLLLVVVLKGAEASLLYESFSAEVVWLMMGAYILGKSVSVSGLAERMTKAILRGANTPNKLFSYIVIALQPLAFFIPSTSGRAAMVLPIVKNLAGLLENKQQKAALAVLVPAVILMSTSASLIAAGSHLIGVEWLRKSTGESIPYLQWLAWGAPFAIAASLITLLVIRFYYLNTESQNREGFKITAEEPAEITEGHSVKTPFSDMEKKTMYLIGGVVLLWVTEGIHGYDIAFVTMTAAMLLMMPGAGILTWKQGISAVSWNLIVFVAAAAALGTNLIESGAVDWISAHVFGSLSLLENPPEWLAIIILCLISVTSHLYIPSHTTRAVVMVPGLLLLSETLGLNAPAVLFISLVGMNYCLTFPVSSKALLVFFEDENLSYEANDLLKLSTILMPVYLLLMVVFYFTYWKFTGLQL